MNRSALLALTAAGLMFGLTVPLSKLALGWLDPAWLAAVRFGLAAPVLALMAWRSLRPALTPRVALWGGFGYGAMVVLQNFGVQHTSVTHAAIIFGAVPVFVAGGAALTGRAVAGPAAWSGFGIALAGVALVAGSGGDAAPR
jgi:drug/metabolite transporter (DMT)-like permease